MDLIKQILTLKNATGFSYTVTHIQNKSTKQTKRVDLLAKTEAKNPTQNDIGYIKPKACRANVVGKTILFEALGQELKIRIFEHVPANRRKDSLYKIKFETKIDGNTEKYLSYCSEAVNRLLHRHHYYIARFNHDKKNPTIESVKEITK